MPARTVGDPLRLDLAEHRGQLALPPRLGAAPRHPAGPDDRSGPGLPPRSQVQVILQQLPQQLPTIDLQPRLRWWRIAGS